MNGFFSHRLFTNILRKEESKSNISASQQHGAEANITERRSSKRGKKLYYPQPY